MNEVRKKSGTNFSRGILIAAAAVALVLACGGIVRAGDTGPGGVSCTYAKCMDNCAKAGGKACTAYCEKTIRERQASGVCK